MRRRLLCGVTLIALVAGLSLSKQILGPREHLLQTKSVAPDADVLESVFYEHFFKSIATQDAINVKAKTGLDDEDMSVLRTLAQQCETDIARVVEVLLEP